MTRIVSTTLWVCISVLLIAPLAAWSVMALWFRLPVADSAKVAIAGAFALIAIVTTVALFTRHSWPSLLVFALAFAAVAIWWSTIQPKADGDWASDVSRQTTGTLNGDILTISDVRDFDWRTEDDFTERWSPRSYDLSKLKTLDLFLIYWAGPEMAHLIMSFGFDGGDNLAWSIEIRREKNG